MPLKGAAILKKTKFSVKIYELQNTKFLRDYSNTVCFGSASVAFIEGARSALACLNGKLYQNLTL